MVRISRFGISHRYACRLEIQLVVDDQPAAELLRRGERAAQQVKHLEARGIDAEGLEGLAKSEAIQGLAALHAHHLQL